MVGISIVVPVYNVKNEYLKKCVDSLISQTYSKIEIILIDDCSTDKDVTNICSSYCKKDCRVVYKRLDKNQGASNARNVGLEDAKYEWVLFVDSDDWIDYKACEKLIKHSNLSTDIIIFNAFVVSCDGIVTKNKFLVYDEDCFIDDASDIITQIVHKKSAMYVPKNNCVGVTWGKLYRKEFLMNNQIRFDVELKRAEDHVFLLTSLNFKPLIYYVDDYLYYYRNNDSSIVHSRNINVKITFKKTLDKMSKILDIDENSKLKKIFYKRVTEYLIGIFTNDYFHKSYKIGYKEFIEEMNDVRLLEPYKSLLDNMNSVKFNWKEFFILILIKYRLYLILFLLFKIKRHIFINKGKN